MDVNPAHSVRRPKHVVKKGKRKPVGSLTLPLSQADAYRMIRRRAKAAGIQN
jgi:hypothetical protein